MEQPKEGDDLNTSNRDITESSTGTEKPTDANIDAEEQRHREALALFETHRDYFEHYAKGGVKVLPAPKTLNTFAFDLKKDTIYVNNMFYLRRGFPEQRTVFGTLHEIEHFGEKKRMLMERGGKEKFENYLKRLKSSRAYKLMDNCVADIRENRAVISRTNEEMAKLEKGIYKEVLFENADFRKQPKHIQFAEALLRESRVTDEVCIVSDEVRVELDKIKQNKNLLPLMTDPNTPMSLRLRLQNKFIWPIVEKLLKEDLEDKKKQKEKEKDKPSESDDSQTGENEPGDGETPDEKKKDGEPQDGEETDKPKGGKNGEDDEGEPKQGGSVDNENPDIVFDKDYKEAEDKFAEAVPVEEIEKALKEWKEEQNGDKQDKADQAYAEKLGVDKNDLIKYREFARKINEIKNEQTGVSLLEELKDLFNRIIAKRTKKAHSPQYPLPEGEELVDPGQLVADVRSGNLEPHVWQDVEIKERKGDKFGEVEITLICDRSSSMTDGDGTKAEEQRKSAVLVMEVLKEFAVLCKQEEINLEKPLDVRSEIYGFKGNESDDRKPLKEMSSELGEAERIRVLKHLYDLPGSTTDFNCLNAINSKVNKETLEKIKSGELKKIVIVFTDGGSDNPGLVQTELNKMRENGIVVIGIGLTEKGSPVLTTYAPNAMVVQNVTKLPVVLGELLKEHLKDI